MWLIFKPPYISTTEEQASSILFKTFITKSNKGKDIIILVSNRATDLQSGRTWPTDETLASVDDIILLPNKTNYSL